MVSIKAFRELALSLEGAEEVPHFERRAFKIPGKRIFATLLERDATINIMLTPSDQATFCAFDKKAVYPVPNKWGLHGVTTFKLSDVPIELVSEALLAAYRGTMAAKKKK